MKLMLFKNNGSLLLQIKNHQLYYWFAAVGGISVLALVTIGLSYTPLLNLSHNQDVAKTVEKHLTKQEKVIAELFENTQRTRIAMIQKMADLYAQIIRLNALGEHLAKIADIQGKFDLSVPPPLGGNQPSHFTEDSTDIDALLNRLEAKIIQTRSQISILSSILTNTHYNRATALNGYPVKSGWISSHYGYRIDPFSSQRSLHHGVDFVGQYGSPITAIASGIVIRAERYKGYGLCIDVDHRNGFITRYAHNSENIVAKGDVVEKGQTIARMGNTGRSTGTHLHFEVRRTGSFRSRSVNPMHYLQAQQK